MATSERPLFTKKQVLVIYAGLMTATFLSALDGTVVNTALVTITKEFREPEKYTWVGVSYLLLSTTTAPLFAKLSDVYGRRRFVILAIMSFVVGSLLCGHAATMNQLVLFRGLQGIGGGGINALSMLVIADIIPPRDRGRYMGAFMSMYAVASVAGPLIGGFLTEGPGWRWAFYVNIPIGLIALAMCTFSLRMPKMTKHTDLDLFGSTLLTAMVGSLILAIEAPNLHWSNATANAIYVIDVMLLGVFIWWEKRTPGPIVPLHLFRNKVLLVVLPVVTFGGCILAAVSVFMPRFLQLVTDVTPTNSGLLMSPMMGSITITGIIIGRRTAITGKYRRYPIRGMAISIIGTLTISQIADSTLGVTCAIVGMAMLGVSIGSTIPVSSIAAQNAVEHTDIGAASSIVLLFRSIGNTVALAIFGTLYNNRFASEVRGVDPQFIRNPAKAEPAVRKVIDDATTNSVSYIFLIAVGMSVAGFLFALFLEERELRTDFEGAVPVEH